ncbi:Guanine nucleotide exchange factor for Cdc42p, partial [Coemansia sp. RSA 2603]
RVEDWKGYLITTFGELHLHGTFVMSTTGVERELLIYLFENILICCKEVSEKDKKRSQKHKPNALQLKGRIFLFSIHSVVDTSRDGHFSLTIYWRDVVMENFSLACKSEEQLKKWKDTMEKLIARTNERASSANQTPGSGNSQSQHGAGNDYDSDEDITNVRRGRFSEGSSLTAAMQQEKSQSSLTYRKTYDGGASRNRNNAKKLASDYQTELADGIERSATISTFHRRQGTNGSSSSFGESGDLLQHRNRTSPMPSGYYNEHDNIPPVPVPPLNRADGDTLGRLHPPRAPGTIALNSPIPTAFTSSMSPMTPGQNGVVPGGQLSAMSSVTTPVPSIASMQSISNQ